MKATLTNQDATINYSFDIELNGLTYRVQVYLNQKGKFIDDSITLDDRELDGEGEEGQTREDILNYLDENWTKLVG